MPRRLREQNSARPPISKAVSKKDWRAARRLMTLPARWAIETLSEAACVPARASPGFCDDVPSIVGKMFTDWEAKECEKIHSPTVACQDVMKEVILFCGIKGAK